jgi:TPR repeat protein
MSTTEWATEPDLAALQSAHCSLRDDPVRAMAELNTLANSGSLMSLVYLGYMFEEGLGVEASLSKAEDFYTRAFASGSISGAFSLDEPHGNVEITGRRKSFFLGGRKEMIRGRCIGSLLVS